MYIYPFLCTWFTQPIPPCDIPVLSSILSLCHHYGCHLLHSYAYYPLNHVSYRNNRQSSVSIPQCPYFIVFAA